MGQVETAHEDRASLRSCSRLRPYKNIDAKTELLQALGAGKEGEGIYKCDDNPRANAKRGGWETGRTTLIERAQAENGRTTTILQIRMKTCWNSALCYQVYPVLLVDDLKRFSVLASPDTSLSSLCNQLNQSILHLWDLNFSSFSNKTVW